MIYLFLGTLLLLASGGITLQFLLRMRLLRSAELSSAQPAGAGRYRPMLRLLSDDDFAFVSDYPIARQKLRRERRRLFRWYLRCLAKDYAHLLAGIRLAMIRSGADRPDLAKALAVNRARFAFAMCRVELRLGLHAAGIGRVDISGLIEAFDMLRNQAGAFAALPAAA